MHIEYIAFSVFFLRTPWESQGQKNCKNPSALYKEIRSASLSKSRNPSQSEQQAGEAPGF